MKLIIKLKSALNSVSCILMLSSFLSLNVFAENAVKDEAILPFKSVEVSGASDITIDIPSANIVIQGIAVENNNENPSSGSVKLQAKKDVLDLMNVTSSASAIDVMVSKDDAKNISGESVYILVPVSLNVSAKTTLGNVRLRNLSGAVEIESIDGEVSGEGLKGTHKLSSVNGNVILRESSGTHHLESINGKVEIAKVKGVLSVKNVSGDIDVQSTLASLNASSMKGNIQGQLDGVEKIQLSTVNGNVNLGLYPRDAATIVIETVSGDVTLGVSEEISASFNLAVHQNGSINNAFSETVEQSDSIGNDNAKQQSSFKLGAGSANVDVSTLNGNIAINKIAVNHVTASPEKSTNEEAEFDWSSVDHSKLQFAYVNPDVDFSSYKKVYISPVKIEFDEQWVRQFGSSGYRKYKERVEKRFAERFRDILVKQIKKKTNWKIVKNKKDALIILPKVTNVFINTPEEIGMRDTVITVAGRAALDLTFYSPRDKTVWAMFVDKRNSIRLSSAEATLRTRVANEKSFSKLFSVWMKTVLDYVNE